MSAPLRHILLFGMILMAPFARAAEVTVDGSSTVFPILQAAAEAYKVETGKDVAVGFSGTSAGFRKFIAGETDLQNASRPIQKEEIELAKAAGLTFVEIPIAYDALTIAVHPEATWIDSIKTSELKKLWEPAAEGKITKWSDIRPEWPNEEILLYGAGGDSGTYDYFAEVIVGGKALRKDYFGSEDDVELVKGIRSNKHALGFIPFAYFSAEAASLKAVPIEHDIDVATGEVRVGKPITPSNQVVMQGIYVPLGRPLFLYVNEKAFRTKPAVEEFVDYFLTNAGTFIRKVDYLPLSAIAYKQGLKNLEKGNVGTRFGGKTSTGVAFHDLMAIDPE